MNMLLTIFTWPENFESRLDSFFSTDTSQPIVTGPTKMLHRIVELANLQEVPEIQTTSIKILLCIATKSELYKGFILQTGIRDLLSKVSVREGFSALQSEAVKLWKVLYPKEAVVSEFFLLVFLLCKPFY